MFGQVRSGSSATPLARTSRRLLSVGALTAVLVAGGVVVADASTSTRAATACRAANGVLKLASSRGACPRGTTHVTLGATGPRGATGARGATGRRGAVGPAGGPGAMPIDFTSNSTTATPVVLAVIDGWTFSASCDISGTTALTADATLISTPPPGVTYAREYSRALYIYGPSESVTVDQVDPVVAAQDRPGLAGPQSLHSYSLPGYAARVWYSGLQFVGSNGHLEQLVLRTTSNGQATLPAGESRCMLEGSVYAAT